jgi:DNA-binding LacI/PurR family transcriptional regulator
MGEVNRINKVKLRRGTCKELAKVFKVSTTTVSLAASGINNSKLAQKIRKAAVEMGGDAIYSRNN